MSPPVSIEQVIVVRRPTAAARALSVEGMTDIPAQVRKFKFQCTVSNAGRIQDCATANQEGITDPAAFRGAVAAEALESETDFEARLRGIARRRLQYYILSKDVAQPSSEIHTVLITEQVSAADVIPAQQSQQLLVQDDLVFETDVTTMMSDLYPPAALRAEVSASVATHCIVLGDLSLLCRDAHVISQNNEDNTKFNQKFESSTLRAFAATHVLLKTRSGIDAIGHGVDLKMNWQCCK